MSIEIFFAGPVKSILEMVAGRIEALSPKDAKLMAEAARFHFLAGETRKAEELLRFADLLEPRDSEVQRLTGRALLAAGRRAAALASYEKVLVRDSPSRKAVALSAIDLAEARLPREAARFMDAFLAREPEDWQWFLAFGQAFLTGGFRKQAAPWFARAVYVKPDEEDVMIGILRAFTDTQSVM